MPFIEVEPGTRLYYEEFGEGKPIVFIHGGAQSHEMWEQQVYELADHYRTVTYDLRGCGESDKPAFGHTLERFVTDLEVLTTNLGLNDISLVCHGIGGYFGVTFAVRHPEIVSRLALVGTAARFSGADEERGGFDLDLWTNYKKAMAVNKAEACAWLIDNTFFHKDPGQATKQVILATMVKWPLYAWKLFNRSIEKADLAPILGDLKASTLILHGEHDRKQRYSGVAHLAASIPGAQIVTFSESAHMPHLEEPEKFNRVLTDFIEDRL